MAFDLSSATPLVDTPKPIGAPAESPTPAPAPKIPEKDAKPPEAAAPATPGAVPDVAAGGRNAFERIADLEKQRADYKPPKLDVPKEPKTPQEGLSLWGGIAIAFAALASARTRTPMTSSLNAIAAAFKGMQEKNHEAFERNYKQWELDTKTAMESYNAQKDAYADIMQRIDKREGLYEKAGEIQDREALAQFKALTSSFGDAGAWDAYLRGGWPEVKKYNEMRDLQAQKLKAQNEMVGRNGAQQIALEDLKKDPEFQKADRETRLKMLTDVIGKTNPPKLNSLANEVFTPEKLQARVDAIKHYRLPPPTGYFARTEKGQEILQALAEDPNYSDMNYGLIKKAKTNLLGKDGDQIISFTKVAHHLETFEALAKALPAGTDSQLWNSIINTITKQAGYENVTNFDLAKKIVGDELVKAVIGAGGTGGDRQEIQDALDRAGSPEQLAGVAATARRLIQGQIQGLVSKYRTMLQHDWMSLEEIVPAKTLKGLGVTNLDALSDTVTGGEKKDPNDVGALDKEGMLVLPDAAGATVDKASAGGAKPPEPKAPPPAGAEHRVYVPGEKKWYYKVGGKWKPEGE